MTEPTSPDVTELIERLHQIAENDWRMSFLAHTSDTAKEAADALLASRQEIERLTAERDRAIADHQFAHVRAEKAEAALRLSAQGREDVVLADNGLTAAIVEDMRAAWQSNPAMPFAQRIAFSNICDAAKAALALPHSDGAVAEPVAVAWTTAEELERLEHSQTRGLYELGRVKSFIHGFRAIPLYLTSPINPVPAGVGVKKLEWINEDQRWAEAPSLVGLYRIGVGDDGVYWFLSGTQKRHRCESISAAKAAAQADYETRIRSALVLRQAPNYTPQILEMDREGDPCWEFVERDCLTITGEVFAANVEQICDADRKLIGFRIYKKRSALARAPTQDRG